MLIKGYLTSMEFHSRAHVQAIPEERNSSRKAKTLLLYLSRWTFAKAPGALLIAVCIILLVWQRNEASTASDTYLILGTMPINDFVKGSKNYFDSGKIHSGLSEVAYLQLSKSFFLFFEKKLVRPWILSNGHFVLIFPVAGESGGNREGRYEARSRSSV